MVQENQVNDSQRQHAFDILNRRQLLRIGGLGCMGLNLGGLFAAQAAQAAAGKSVGGTKKIKSCILMFLYGGPSHLDTWDPKPRAPREIRGEFQSIATTVPGVRISEQLPRCARIMHKLAIIRSMHHPMTNHNAAAVEAMCGRTPIKGDLELLADDAASFPCYGSALTHLIREKRVVPPHVALPHVMYNVVVLPGQTAGFLGSAYNPMQVTADPNRPDFRVGELELPASMTLNRLEHRESLLHLVDQQLESQEKAVKAKSMNVFYQRAFSLLRSDEVRRSFDIAQENERTRERYGRTTLGQSALLARRLVESGVRFVSVHDKVHNGLDNWDTHVKNFSRLKDDLLPPVDRALSALVDDLDVRGLLESTLVICIGEFGRTPKINRDAGRDHYPYCFSLALAGGGIRGGAVHGSSDKIGAHPDSDAVTPGDLAATIFTRFGLNPKTIIRDTTGRPYHLADGEAIQALFDHKA